MFVVTMSFLSCNALNAIPLKHVSMNNEVCRIRPEIININSNQPTFCPYSIKVHKCSGSCNNNLMSRTNETRHIEWHETCKCKCRLDVSVCNNKQCWNNDKCRCACKQLSYNGICDKEFVWIPSNCECKCNKSCDVGEYLDYENCKCRKRLVDKLVEECSENIDEI